MKVGLSFAHNPTSPGACHEGSCEHSASKKWTSKLAFILAGRGIDTLLTRSHSLTQKVIDINAGSCDLAIEIHFNACGGCGASGCETLHYPDSETGQLYALIMQEHLVEAIGNNDRGAKAGWYKMDRPGVIDFYGDEDGDEKPDYFLRKTNCPALILEPEFIEHADVIADSMQDAVVAIADAIEEIFNEQKQVEEAEEGLD